MQCQNPDSRINNIINNPYVRTLEPEVLKLIEILIRSTNSKKILEIGTGFGVSAIAMQKVSGGRVDTIEKVQEHANMAFCNFEAAGLKSEIQVIVGDALLKLDQIDDVYDFILLDGSKKQYPLLLEKLLERLKIGGLLVADNVLFRGMVQNSSSLDPKKAKLVKAFQEYIRKISNHPELITSILPIGDGVSISLKICKKFDID